MYKIVKFNEPKYLCDCLPKKIENNYNLLDSTNVRNVRARAGKFRESLIPDCIRLWHDLPDDVKLLDSYASFKNKVTNKPIKNTFCN